MSERTDVIEVTTEAWIALLKVLMEFAGRADAGQAARDALSDLMHAVIERNPHLLDD